MTFTKADLVDVVYEALNEQKNKATELVDLALEAIKEELCKDGTVKVSGFGKFLTHSKKARLGRNPQTGEPMKITARRVMTFTPSRILRNAVNGKTTVPPSQVPDESDE